MCLNCNSSGSSQSTGVCIRSPRSSIFLWYCVSSVNCQLARIISVMEIISTSVDPGNGRSDRSLIGFDHYQKGSENFPPLISFNVYYNFRHLDYSFDTLPFPPLSLLLTYLQLTVLREHASPSRSCISGFVFDRFVSNFGCKLRSGSSHLSW